MTETAMEGMKYLNAAGTWNVQGVRVTVTVMDTRVVFGRRDFLVQPSLPISFGDNHVWVSAEMVTLDNGLMEAVSMSEFQTDTIKRWSDKQSKVGKGE